MALSNNALTTLALTKSVAGITDSSSDALLEALIESISEQAKTFIGRRLVRATYTDNRDPSGRQLLLLTEAPIVSITSVEIDGEAITDYELKDEDKRKGALYKDTGWTGTFVTSGMTRDFANWVRGVKVVYVAGYLTPPMMGYTAGGADSLPLDLQLAIATQVSAKFNEIVRQSQGLVGLTQGGLSYRWADGSSGGAGSMWIGEVGQVLGRYKRGWCA